ncbi:MAG: histidine kinase [Bacteroidetes bacterium]|nr:histidine kinase [Bacteroidota bacterium]
MQYFCAMSTTTLCLLFVLVFFIGLACGALYQAFFKKNTLQQQNARLKKELEDISGKIQDIELTQSKFILNPHLFKNTLNSIQSYAFRTHQSLERLGGVLDYILYDSNTELVSVQEELEFARNFIDLNKIKLNPLFDIRVKVKIDEHHPLYSQPLLTPLITAYFIENAFKHADLQSPDAFISIVFELKDDHFYYTVSNKILKHPIFKEKGGIGKKNIEKRLDITYKDSYKIDYFTEGHVYTAYLKINLIEFKSKMLDIG